MRQIDMRMLATGAARATLSSNRRHIAPLNADVVAPLLTAAGAWTEPSREAVGKRDNASKPTCNRYLISCFSSAAAYCRLLPTMQKSPEKPLVSQRRERVFLTTDQKVSGSTPDGCATQNQALTQYKNSADGFFF